MHLTRRAPHTVVVGATLIAQHTMQGVDPDIVQHIFRDAALEVENVGASRTYNQNTNLLPPGASEMNKNFCLARSRSSRNIQPPQRPADLLALRVERGRITSCCIWDRNGNRKLRVCDITLVGKIELVTHQREGRASIYC